MNKTYRNAFSSYGIARAIKEVNADFFNSLFGDDFDYQLLDDYIDFYNGDYCVLDSVQNLFDIGRTSEQAAKALARILLLKYSESWSKIKAVLAVDANILRTYSTTVVESNKGSVTHVASGTDKTVNSRYGFNSVSSVKSDESENNHSSDNSQNNTNELTRTESGYKDGGSITELKTKAVQFERMNKFFDMVAYDIVTNVCYVIY